MNIARHTIRRSTAAGAAFTLAAATLLPVSGAEARTVTMSGNAYAFIFGGNNDRLEGATIRLVEYPDITTTAGVNGAYSLQVPNNASVTPYVEFPGYYTTHLQTFHTDGRDLRQVNFQVPELSIYRALAGITGAKIDPKTGLLEKCAIVSTFFELKGRSFKKFNEFHEFHPHGVPGSTAVQSPASGRQYYFNKDVIPDPDQEVSSRDGGVLWADVETGKYQVKAYNPDTRFASFVANCQPGRLVNANPPWGLYELAGNELVNPVTLPDRRVDARQLAAHVSTSGRKRVVKVRLKASEHAVADIVAKQGERRQRWDRDLAPGKRVVRLPLGKKFRQGRLKLTTTLRDDAGNLNQRSAVLAVPGRRP